MGEVADQGGDGQRVLGVGEVVGHADAQRDRRHADALELGVEHADQPGDALVRRRRQGQAAGQLGVGGAADDERQPGVRHGVGRGADGDDGLAPELRRRPRSGAVRRTRGHDRCGSTPLSTTRSWAPPVRTTRNAFVGQRDLAGLAVDELDHRAFLGEVVERVGVDLADGHARPRRGGRARSSPRRRRRTSRSGRRAGPGWCSGPSSAVSSVSTSSTAGAGQRVTHGAASAVVLDEVVDAAPSAPRRRPGRWPGTCRCAAGCGRACGSCRCRRCRWPAARR